MKIETMKVSQITNLLKQQDLPQSVIDALQIDIRPSVQRLFAKWVSRKQRLEHERQGLLGLYRYESSFYNQGCEVVAGIDEAGRGPLAGPLVVAAVALPRFVELPELNDSKQLTAKQRESLYASIHKTAIAISWKTIPVELIDEINIYQATVCGMYQVVTELHPAAQAVLIDAVKLPDLPVPWQALIGGDALSASIAAASVIAKVERDRIMLQLHKTYPEYGFDKHKGYATKAHLAALHKYGPTPVHRRSFEPVKSGGGLFGSEAGYYQPKSV